MKKIAITAVVAASFMGYAQAQESTAVTSTVVAQPTTILPQAAPQPIVEQPQALSQQPTVQVVQQPVVQQPVLIQEEMVKQPTTVIEATPLTTSKADELRRAREQTEIDTEQKIVEKLEESRIQAEKARQQAILGSFSEATSEKKEEPAPQPQSQVQPQPQVIMVTPQNPQAASEAEKAPSLDEVRNAVREELSAVAPKEESKKAKNYFSGSVGMIDYDSADIRTVGAVGASFGKLFDERWAAEFSIGGANAYVDESEFLYRKMDQLSLGGGARFFILTGRVQPSVGFLVSYVHRNYSEFRDSAIGYSLGVGELSSWAIDYGLSIGLDFAMSDNLTLGMEYKYINNLTYEYDDEVLNTASYRNYYGYFEPLEERSSDFLGFSVKYLF